ncbi:MAG TPA: thiolase family protein [Hyphomicrobiaceae bacterium]|nr:thiolase family protein [Hyphomicrobiaceae bacterium]
MHLTPISIVGIGQTRPVRRSEKGLRALVVEAIEAAIADSGLSPSDIDGVITDGLVMPTTVPRDYIAAQFGIDRRFDGGMSYGGAGSAAAPGLAQLAISTGQAKAVLYYFGVDWGTRASGPYGFHDLYAAKMAFEKPYGFTGQPSYFGLWAKRYMHEYGLTERDLAMIAVTQRESALLNPLSQSKTPMTYDDYFAARMISDPLRVPDCCLITDGACAFVMTSLDRARDLPKPPVRVLGTGFGSEPITGDDVFTQPAGMARIPGARAATGRALAQAGLTLEDVDFAEVYDCFTISCLLQIEEIGFCKRGEGAAFIREKGMGIGGGLPINTHGGLLSHSYLLGVEHVIEAVRQLRGEAGAGQVRDARVGLVGGLSNPDYGVVLLGRDA